MVFVSRFTRPSFFTSFLSPPVFGRAMPLLLACASSMVVAWLLRTPRHLGHRPHVVDSISALCYRPPPALQASLYTACSRTAVSPWVSLPALLPCFSSPPSFLPWLARWPHALAFPGSCHGHCCSENSPSPVFSFVFYFR